MTLDTRSGLRTGMTVLALALSLSLAACGSRDSGDGALDGSATTFDANGQPTNGSPTLGAAVAPTISFELFSDATDIETGGSDVAVISATLIDDQRVPVADAPVEWSASGGVLQDVTATTDENGVATATLRMPQDFRNRDVDVGVTSGEFGSAITVRAYGTALEVQGAEQNVVLGNELELGVTLTAGNGDPIINKAITVTTANGNTVSPLAPVTDSNGRATIRVGSAIGGDTVTIEALGDESLTQRFSFDVSSDQLAFSTAGNRSEFTVNSFETVDVTWSTDGRPVIDGALRVSTTAGQILADSVLRTDATGSISVPISSSSAGSAQITVQDAVDGDPSATFDVEFVATAPALVDLSTTSSRVYVDDLSDITALVRDVNGNPVKNQEVVFTSNDLRGGQLSPSSALTDAEGRARTGFTAGSNATEIDAIEIFGTVQGVTTANGAPLTSSLRLSVVERRLNVTIGAGSGLTSAGLDTQYLKNMVVQVADGSGAPLSDARVALSITPITYSKGSLTLVDRNGRPFYTAAPGESEWSADHWGFVSGTPYTVECPAEDVNLNRILDAELSEDTNGNGMLDPQDPAVLTAVADSTAYATIEGNGTLNTDTNGTGYFVLQYPKSNAYWSHLRITARATALGTEAQDSLEMYMPVLATDLSDTSISPPNLNSPYGASLNCADAG